jgi:hypothetical protein
MSQARAAAVDRAAAALRRRIFPPELFDDQQLRLVARVAVDAAWPVVKRAMRRKEVIRW